MNIHRFCILVFSIASLAFFSACEPLSRLSDEEPSPDPDAEAVEPDEKPRPDDKPPWFEPARTWELENGQLQLTVASTGSDSTDACDIAERSMQERVHTALALLLADPDHPGLEGGAPDEVEPEDLKALINNPDGYKRIESVPFEEKSFYHAADSGHGTDIRCYLYRGYELNKLLRALQ